MTRYSRESVARARVRDWLARGLAEPAVKDLINGEDDRHRPLFWGIYLEESAAAKAWQLDRDDPRWRAIVKAYRATPEKRPSQERVAETMGRSESSLRDEVHSVGFKDWRDVHAYVASEPD